MTELSKKDVEVLCLSQAICNIKDHKRVDVVRLSRLVEAREALREELEKEIPCLRFKTCEENLAFERGIAWAIIKQKKFLLGDEK